MWTRGVDGFSRRGAADLSTYVKSIIKLPTKREILSKEIGEERYTRRCGEGEKEVVKSENKNFLKQRAQEL